MAAALRGAALLAATEPWRLGKELPFPGVAAPPTLPGMHGSHEGARGADHHSTDDAAAGTESRPQGTRITPQQWALEALARVAPPMPRAGL